jgi:hypothetical protein
MNRWNQYQSEHNFLYEIIYLLSNKNRWDLFWLQIFRHFFLIKRGSCKYFLAYFICTNCYSYRKNLNELEAVFVDGMSNQRNTRTFPISLKENEILHTDNHHVRSTFLLCVIYEVWKRLKSRNFTLHRSFELRVFKSLYSQTYCIPKQTRL